MHSYMGAVSRVHLAFLVDEITPEQRRSLYCAQIIPEYFNRVGTNLRFQNEHCSSTDCMPGYTASHSPDSSFSSIRDIPKPTPPPTPGHESVAPRREARDLIYFLLIKKLAMSQALIVLSYPY